jgi:hypothetical protein
MIIENMNSKFKYTNSHGEVALYEATPLTSELYKEILETDKTFLQNIQDGKVSCYIEEKYITAAKEMLISYGKGKNANSNSGCPDDSEILFVSNKKVLKSSEKSDKKISQTPKAFLRKALKSSNIRLFKKNKIERVLDAE